MITATLLPSILPTTWTQQVLSIVGLLFALGSLVYVIERFLVSTPYPPGIALIREGPDARRFSLRTRLAYYTDCKNLFQEAWDKVRMLSFFLSNRDDVSTEHPRPYPLTCGWQGLPCQKQQPIAIFTCLLFFAHHFQSV
jgi:hypothetical protein